MNYTDKSLPNGSGQQSLQFESDASAETPRAVVAIPDAHLLFSGDFVRVGTDLILSDQLHRVVVPNYFRDHARPLLVSPEGAHLDPGVIDALTGHTQYAQAGAPVASGKVVGHVVKMTGSASIVRNGVTIVVNVGDAVNQNDVVQTGSDSTLGLVLDDGTTFNLSAGARFMLNELTYDASSTSNSSLMTLVQGAASFVAGQVAKTGDMRVATPSATIGIRGTAVILDVSATDGRISVSVIDQRDGQVHAVQVFNTAGVLIGTVTSNGSTLTLTPTANFDVIAQQSNKTTDQVAQEFGAFQQVLSTYDAGKQLFPNLPQHTENRDQNNNNNPNPNSTTKFAGSPPLQPPGTEYHPLLGTSATPPSSAVPPVVVVTVNPASDTGTSPPTSNTVVGGPIIVPVKLSAVPFVVTPPNVAAITSGPGDHIGPVMSANGDVVYDPDGAIYFFNHETGATTTIASPANGWSYGSPTISFDGRYIVYQGSDGGGSFVFVYGTDPSDSAHYHVQTALAPGSAAAVSGDGSTIVVQQDGGNVAIYGLDGTLKGTVTPGTVGSSGALWKPAISADGHLIAFWNSDAAAPGGGGRLLAFNLSTGELAVIASTSAGAGVVAPTISADGRLIAYQETDGTGHSEIYLYDLNAGAVVFHTSNASGSSYSPVLSPDGHFIVFTSEARLTSADQNGFADIYIVDVTNPAAPAYRLVSDGVDTASNGGAAISAGGQYVAFGNSSNIFFADPTSGLSTIILETVKSPDVLTAKGSIAVTGDYTGVAVSVSDQFGGATPYFSASFDSNGHINWSFAEPKNDFAGLSFGETATQEFVIRLSADNGFITIPVFVTVHDGVQPPIQTVDAAPVAAPVTLAQGQQDSPYVITPTALLRGVSDIDGPSLSISSLTIQSGGGGLVRNSDQTWTYTPDPGFSGHVVFGYTVSDSIKSAASTASLNITLPLAITAIGPDSGASGDFITNSTQLSVSGSNGALSPGEKIQVSGDNGLTWSDVVQATGTTWSLVDPGVHNASFSYQVRVVDSVGNTIGSAAQAVTIDTAPPVVTIENSNALTNQATQRISGTVGLADAGTTVIVFDNAQAIAGAVVQADGSWSVIVQLSEGGNSFVAQDTDVAGNLGSSNTVVLTLDSTPPAAVASVLALSADSGSSATDFNTSVPSQTVSGTYTGALGAGETIQVSANNGATWVTASASGGAWSASGVSLSSGTNLLSVRTIDLAGNVTAGAGHSYTLDTLAPTAVATVTLLSSDTGSSSTDFVTNIASQTVSGTYAGVLAFGETIQVSADGGVSWVTATANAANGTWSASGVTLSPGGNTLSVRTIDLAGNIAAGTGHSYVFDTVAPSAFATVAALGSDSGSSSSDFVTNVASQTVSGTYSGTLSAGESIQVSADGGAAWVTAIANASNGTWAASGVSLLAAGSTLSVRTIDLAGNSLAGTGHAYTLDTGAPSAVATVTALSSDSGGSASDFVTNVAPQTVTGAYTGTLGPGESIQLSIDGTNWVTANAAGGAWSASGVILSGAGSLLSVRTIDLAGNVAAGIGHSYVLDQTVPSGGTPDLIASSDSGSSSSDNSTNVLAPTLTVALGAGVAVGDTVELLLNGSSFSHPLVRTVTSGDIAAQSVSFAVSPGDLGSDGLKLISGRFTDLAGNSSTTSALTITLDTSAPVLAITNPGGNTNQSVQTITGTADPADAGAIVTVLDDGISVGVATIQANGSWSTDVTLHSDTNSLTAQATDAAGNQGVSNTVVFTLSTNAPSGGTPDLVAGSDSGSSSSDNTTNVTAPTFTVVLGANVAVGDTIQLLLNGSPFAHPVTHTISAVDIGAQSVSLTVTDGDLGADGAKSISARLSDSFGNSSTTAALIITLDTAAPTVSSEAITSATGAQNSTLSAGDVVSVTVTFSESVTVTGTPQLVLNIGGTPVQASYASGSGSSQLVFTYTIQAGQTDANGISLDANALSLNGGTITDAAGNAAVLTAAAVADNASYVVDTGSPTESVAITSVAGSSSSTSTSITVTGTNGTLAFGDKVQISTDNVTWTDVVRNGSTRWSFTDSTVRSANFTYFTRVVDSAGNVGATASLPILVASGGASVAMSPAGGVVEFTGTGGTLQIGAAVTATINAISIASGPVAIGGSGNIATSAGDAIDLYATGASAGNPANLTVNPTGQITGAGSAISVIQNAAGSITVTTSGTVIGQAGRGILAQQNATGTGGILINGSGNVTGTGAAFSGIVAVNLNSANNGDITVSQSGNITGGHDGIRVQTNGNGNISITTAPNPLEATAQIIGSTLYGIEAQSKGTGSIQINAGAGTVITSAGVGINAYNEAVSLPKVGGVIASSISVNASGVINSGTVLTGQGSRPAGILAGYKGGTTNTVNANVFGNVSVTNTGTINAAGGDGIRGYNFGPGNVSISNSGTIIAGDVYGIVGSSNSTGNVSVTTTASSSITSGSHGILAINQGTSILQSLGSTVTVTAAGTINSGVHLSAGGAQPAGISAGYYGSNGTSNTNINGSVLVDNAASISARAGYGIIGFNFGYGNITIINRADKSVSGAQFGIAASSSVNGTASPSNVSISVEANSTPTAAAVTASSLMGLAAINANNSSGGNITITTGANDQFTSGGSGINANSAAVSVASGNQISVTTSTGIINSGFNFFSGGGTPAGISAGYSVLSPANIHGNVVVDNAATVTAASGSGINLYNNGNGSISATLRPTSSITAAQGAGVTAFSAAGGSITINNQGAISAAAIGISVGNGSSASVNGLISISNSGTINAPGVPFMPVVTIGNGNSTQTATVSNAAGKFIASNLFARTTNNFAISVIAGNGAVTNNGSITGNISFSGTGSGSVSNALGATWNINGSNFFGSGTNAISNAGIINMLGLAALSGAGAIALSNTGNISVLPNASAQIFANVTGAGSILLGDRSALELGLSVAATQTINFGGKGLLTFDNPASVGTNLPLNFSASGSGNVGSIITLQGGGITAANISGSTLTVSGVQNYAFQVSGTGLSGNMFDVLSPNRIVLVPTSATIISGVTTSQSPLTPASFYILDNDHINSSTGPGFNLATSDGVAANTYTVVANTSSDFVINGAFPGLRVATQGASGAIINAASISGPTPSSGPNVGLTVDTTQNSNIGSGSADIVNYANVSAVTVAISANTVNGNINIVSSAGTLTGTNSYGILGVSNGTGGVTITASGGTITAGFNGIRAAELQETTPGPGGNIIIYNSSTITSGTNTANIAGSGAAGLRARILNNNTTVPNAAITGDVTIENRASITAQAGAGIFADNYGSGNTSVTFAPGQYSITAVNGGATGVGSGLTQYGIFAFTYGTGSSLVNAGWGTTITSGSTGINAGNQATTIASGSGSTVAVYSQGFISSGTNVNNGGSAQSAIQAGYNPGGNGAFSSAVYGDVIVYVASDGNPFGNPNPTLLAAAGPGILAYDYGVGNITVTVGSGVSIQALTAATSSGGGNAPYGIGATNRGSGNIVVVTSNGSSINSGSTGINAVNDANPTAGSDLANLFAANVAAGKPAVVSVTAAGTITAGGQSTNSGGTPSGIAAGFFAPVSGAGHPNQYVSGNVFINNAAVVSAAGFGLQGYNYGYGNITIDVASGANITAGSNGIYAHADGGFTDPVTASALTRDIAVAVYANTTITAGSATFNKAYGILALSTNAGSISVVTSTGDTIDSHQGSAGINAVNEATSIAPSFNSSVIVTNAASIHSGSGTTGFNSQPGGILAGYIGQATDPSLNNPPNPANYNVYGEVVVNNFGDITADAGDGIRAYNFGVGDVSVDNFSGTITALGGANPPNGSGVGILAQNFGPGSVYVTTSASTSITSGSTGIAALNKATTADPLNPSVVVPATAEVFVNASGTIHSGTTPTGTVAADPAAGILAGYNPNNQNTANNAVHGNVLVYDHATIVAPTGTDGIRAVNYGDGDIAVTVESDSRVFAGRYGVAAFGFDGGDVSVTIDGSVMGGTAGLDVSTTGTGMVTIDNAGFVAGVVLGYNAAFTNEAGADWQFSGASAFTGTSTLANAGTIESTGTSSILGLAGFTNTGTIAVESGSLTIGSAVTGGGAAVIYSASLVFSAASDANVAFDTGTSTPGTLVLADAAHFTGTVTGFALGDTIDLVGIAPANVSVSSSGGLHVDFGTGSFALGGSYDPAGFLIASDGQGGAKISWNHQGPVIDTSQLTVSLNSGTYTVTGIQVTDSDPTVPTAPVVTYTPGSTPPAYEKVALTLSDIAGAAQTVNFIFQNGTGTTVQGTSGNDVIFAASGQDVLTGGGGRDQFVFASPPASTPVQHTITDFAEGIDRLDVRQFTNVSWASAADSPNDTLVTLDANDSILLKNIVASNLKPADFIFHV
ncbi:Ig-like domain-containing protein [Bradyrhizobium liaoningense]|uniref:Ig-like domain-containing protein n=1 Tax=Bradyrhizobium liaoningense TaxID=43992 RepID=UPI001BAAB9E9|nr:Ig-like domain-containing protein [Bradyrhizobium liaoningense]MBR0712180.1 cadherin-like domain-containing protein [Bradyrhizobium liaoningense]